jgi:hypothetical protein
VSFRILTLLAAVVPLMLGCGSTSTSLLGPTDGRCSVSLSPTTSPLGPAGGGGSITVTASRECSWSVKSDADWITITSAPTGQGEGRVDYAAASNPTPAVRRGGVLVGDGRTEIIQSGAPCEFTLNPPSGSFGSSGGPTTVAVTTLAGCTWTVTSHDPWISVTSGSSGQGSGSVQLLVAANTGPPRAGTVSIAGRLFTVTQAAACTYSIAPTTQVVPFAGGTFSVQVATQAWCAWSAATSDSFIQLATSGGTGPATVTYQVSPGVLRGTIIIAGQTLTITRGVF